MRYIAKIRKKRFEERVSFDKILQLWFNYHFFFFQSLIFRGLKLRAFTLFISIKFGLKNYKFLENFSDNLDSRAFFSYSNDENFEQEHNKESFSFLEKAFSFDSYLIRKEQEELEFFKTTNFLKYSSLLNLKISLSFIWLFFEFFFIKKLHFFFFKLFFFRLIFFKNLFFFKDPDYFFLTFLKYFFIIWYFIEKNRLIACDFRVYFFKNFFKAIKIKKYNNNKSYYYKYFFILRKYFFFKYFYFFKINLLFFKINLLFLENKWFLANDSLGLVDLGIFRRLLNWNSFFSFFLYEWLLEVKNFKNLLIKQDSFVEDIPVYDPSFVFFLALLKITPVLVLKPIPMGSVNYDMPFPITYWRRISYATRWIINLLKKKSRVVSVEGVVSAILNTLFDEGLSIEKKDEVYSLVSLNRHLLRHRVMRR